MSANEHNQVERIDAPTVEVFRREIEARGRPVVIKGALNNWKALAKWNADYLRSAFDGAEVSVEVSRTNYFPFHAARADSNARTDIRRMSFERFAAAVSKPNGAEKYYLTEHALLEKFPALAADTERPAYLEGRSRVASSFWVSPAGAVTSLHYDVVYSLFAQVSGRKRFVLFAPEQSSLLSPFSALSRVAHFSRVDIDRPDYSRFPRFREARPLECTLEPGELLFLPAFWWHQVYSLDASVSVSFWWRLSPVEYAARPALRTLFTTALYFAERLRR